MCHRKYCTPSSLGCAAFFVMLGCLPFPLCGQSPLIQKSTAINHKESTALYLQKPRPADLAARPKHENRVRLLPLPRRQKAGVPEPPRDSALQSELGDLQVEVIKGTPFDGVGLGTRYLPDVSPPDTTGSVGRRYYVQWVNQAFGIFDKATGTLAMVEHPASGELFKALWNGNVLWKGFGGRCEHSNDGDPIVLYDKLADRWVMSQFAFSEPKAPPYSQCIAVSITDDPAGQYHLYEFQFDNFNDYPKFGIWPDGYYATFDMFENNAKDSPFLGTKVCVFERSHMLDGADASLQCINLYCPQYVGVLPGDFDGSSSSLPPPGSPAYFVGLDSDKLHLWRFSVDWKDSLKSKFEHDEIETKSFEFPCQDNGYSGSCIPQRGSATQRLSSLGDRLMYRLAYRNLGSREALVVNHTIKVGERTGIRWYEIENPRMRPSLRQQGTFAPGDGLFRWMGSIAMDKKGNMLLEYSASSDAEYPSVRYTGRKFNDPLGQMRNERSLVTGMGSQINEKPDFVTDRWGDYSSITIDPVDDCTFWLTNQYSSKTATYNWSTKIGGLKFPDCQ